MIIQVIFGSFIRNVSSSCTHNLHIDLGANFLKPKYDFRYFISVFANVVKIFGNVSSFA